MSATTTGVASAIRSGLYDPSDLNSANTEYWVRNNLGKLNVALHGNFALSGSGNTESITGDSPQWDNRTNDIYISMHEIDYYMKQIRTLLPANSTNQVLEINSDGGRIKMVNQNEMAKTYNNLKKEAEEKLKKMVSRYNYSEAVPSQVAGDDVFINSGNISTDYIRT